MNNRYIGRIAKRVEPDQPPAGYDLGAGLRKKSIRKVEQLGKGLNTLQSRVGARATGIVVALLWLAAFCYFAHLMISLLY
ncbi:hypothetical protein [Telluribacter sp.]|jgi:hypothetical protein|uniref:hypothetical protein n=1 Tax=Telluribacter sp. TaxID=1978767 RepID=UPI002E165471|nr:hypothetical protein [Telluribacter sp.]